MEIEIFTLADFAQDNHSKLTIVGTFDSINAQAFPVVHPACHVATRLRFSDKEIGDHTLKLRLIDDAGKEVIKPIEGNLNINRPANGQFSSVNLVINFNQLKFEKPGRYSFELYIDDDWKSGLPLFLKKIE
ncbi:MAG: hypothetical protein R2796_06350 [Chitinophagaceae bacterium]|nr:hypothetical protein [Chitinophagaceae bacterium]MCB0741677.1 hypothetical protein [Chitinophagaceae bacterium]